MPKTIYFVAGEASADNHGAGLMRAVRDLAPDLRFFGRGGPQMKAIAGERFNNWIEQAGVLGLWEVIKRYPFFRTQFHGALREIEQCNPEAIILIDYPGFNLRLAKALRTRKPKPKIIYYISPQVWAWNRGRIKNMARCIDLMLCIFPFEAALYKESGLRTIFVGHPMIENLQARKIEIPRDQQLIGLFPGSRLREVKKILPIMIETARELVRHQPDLRFEIAAAAADLVPKIESLLRPHLSPLPQRDSDEERRVRLGPEQIKIKVNETSAIMQRAAAGVVASGSATLEAAYFRLPFVLVYKVAWITYVVGRLLVKVKYLGMPNVLANRELAPEFIQHKAQPKRIAAAVLRLINHPAERERMIMSFDQIIQSLGERAASTEAARAIMQEL